MLHLLDSAPCSGRSFHLQEYLNIWWCMMILYLEGWINSRHYCLQSSTWVCGMWDFGGADMIWLEGVCWGAATDRTTVRWWWLNLWRLLQHFRSFGVVWWAPTPRKSTLDDDAKDCDDFLCGCGNASAMPIKEICGGSCQLFSNMLDMKLQWIPWITGTINVLDSFNGSEMQISIQIIVLQHVEGPLGGCLFALWNFLVLVASSGGNCCQKGRCFFGLLQFCCEKGEKRERIEVGATLTIV